MAKSVIGILKPHCCTAAHLAQLERCFTTPMLHLKNLGVVVGDVNRDGWEQLRESVALDETTEAPPLQPIAPLGSAADVTAAAKLSWGLTKIGVPALWARGLTGKGVLVAHLDTGIDGTHPALKGAIEDFAEFDAMGERVAEAAPTDSSDHGTHTAGTIAGRATGPFTIGVAPGCRLVSGMVIDGGDPVKRILAGVDWALGYGIKVLSVSAGFRGHFAQYAPLIRGIRAKGVLPVFAAGNFGPGTSCAPANYAETMAVGAVDEHGKVDPASSSEKVRSRGAPQVPDLAMPGVDVISANAGGGYRADSGTSMAAPHAAGLAALLWEACPSATVDQVEAAIYNSCTLSGAMKKTRAGRGTPDAVKALAALEGSMRIMQTWN